jgi:GntR family transcriptional regulator
MSENRGKRPRYLHVRDQLVQLIESGKWAPGQAIPSEPEIARAFGVATGTARAAVSALVSENLVVRRQGSGTFVYEHTPEQESARFLRLFDVKGGPIGPDGDAGRPIRASANQTERRELGLPGGTGVLRIKRVLARNGAPLGVERISLPEALFPGLAERQGLLNGLYELYQKRYRVLVVEVEDRLTAVPADNSVARDLKVAVGTPLLRIERVAIALGGKPVEWRVGLCNLREARYIARFR